MNFILTFKFKGQDTIHEIELTPEEYYDEIEEGETYENDAIAKYNAEKYYILDHYGDIYFEDLEFTTIELRDSVKSDLITKTLYYGVDSTICYRRNKNGYELIIQSIQVATNCCTITRMERDDSFSEWKNIFLSIGINYEIEHNIHGEEKWLDANKGEFIHQILS